MSRYTLRWIGNHSDDSMRHDDYPDNCDAAFISHDIPKPSDLLLHYNYGVADVKWRGRNLSILDNRPGLQRPQVPELGPRGAQRQRDRSRNEDPEHAVWDEDDIMLFFWMNTPEARERRAQQEQEHNENINMWRAGTDM